MGYLNEPEQIPDPPTNPLKRLFYKLRQGASLMEFDISRRIVDFKLMLQRHGFDIDISMAEMITGRITVSPEKDWNWPEKRPPSEEEVLQCVETEIIPWIHKQVTRSPVPFGTDITVIITAVFYDDRKYEHMLRYVDKYGWRKYARQETDTWLKVTMLKHREEGMNVGAKILSFGKMILTYEKALNQSQ